MSPYEPNTDEHFISTLTDPLKFFNSYVSSDGIDYLRRRFVTFDDPCYYYDRDTDRIVVQRYLPPGDQRGILLEEETNCREYTLTFPEFVREELVDQAKITFELIKENNESNGDDQELKLYKKILIDCIEIHEKIVADPELNFKFELDFLIRKLHDKTTDLFGKYHPREPTAIRSKKYFKNSEEKNITGFKLKNQVRRAPLREFWENLVHSSIIARADLPSFDLFLKGVIPKKKINWLKDLHELKFFIDCLCKPEILEKLPGQQWKYLDRIFKCKGEELPDKWHRNNNKLKDGSKKAILEGLTSLLLPRE